MILICMVSFTAGATTTKPEQKQKTEFVKGLTAEINAVSVANDCQVAFVARDAIIKTEFKVKSFELIKPITSDAINDDVGWRNSSLNYNLHLKINLPGTNRIPIASKFSNKEKSTIRCDC
jgi:hypothetical protein